MNFMLALQALLGGAFIARQAWGPTATVQPIALINGTIYTVTQFSAATPTYYTPVQADILAQDWYQIV